jgi:hypothetical protein
VDEQGWLTSADPTAMLESLKGRASDCRLSMFMAACCRLLWGHLRDGRSRAAVEACERHADGLAGGGELVAARQGAVSARDTIRKSSRRYRSRRPCSRVLHAASAAAYAASVERWSVNSAMLGVMMNYLLSALGAESGAILCGLLRDIVGNPFRPLRLSPSLLTPTIVSLAKASYEERIMPLGHLDPMRLAVLADALEELGATGEAVGHLRSAGPHVRGCFVVDAVLGRG